MLGKKTCTTMALATSMTTSTTRTIGLSSGTKLDTKMKFLLNKEMDPLQRPTPTTRTSTKERAKPDPVLWDLDAQRSTCGSKWHNTHSCPLNDQSNKGKGKSFGKF